MASIEKRPDGRWRARWREYANGPQRSKHFGRKIDAERWLVKVQHDIASGTYLDPKAGQIGLSAFAARWVERQPWRESTRASVKVSIAHLVLELGADRPLAAIRKGDLQAFVTKLGQTRAPSTVRTINQHVHQLFEAAVEDRHLVINPAKGLRLPRGEKGAVVPPTPEQVDALLAAAPDDFRIAIVLGAGLGLRRGEATGLSVDRIDWLRRTARVDRQLIEKTASRAIRTMGPPKTTASIRTVPAADSVLASLAEHVRIHGASRDGGFVLHRDGMAIPLSSFGYLWTKTAKSAGLPTVRFHDLRHYFASTLIAAGCSVKAVQQALGHDNATTTLQTYAHLWPGDEDRIRQAVERGFARSAEDWLRTGEAEHPG